MADGIYVGMAAAAARAEQLDSIADNLANVETPGFKASRPAFESFLPPRAGKSSDKVSTAAVGTGIYEAGQASRLRNEVQTLQQQQAPLTEQIQRLSRDRTDATRQLATLRDENERLNRNTAELLRLRSEVTKLRPVAQRIAKEHESPVSRNSQEGQVPSTGENAETKMRDLQIDEKLNQLREKIGLRKGAGRPLAETFGQPDVQGRCTVGKIAEIFTRFTCLVRDYPGC